MRRFVKVMGIVLAVAVIASAIGIGTVMAADPTPTPTPNASAQPTVPQVFLSKLAARLNITVDQLKAAVTGAGSDTLKDLAAQGRITEEQRAAMEKRLQSGDFGGMMGGFGGMMGRFGRGMMGGGWGGNGGPGVQGCPGWGGATPAPSTAS